MIYGTSGYYDKEEEYKLSLIKILIKVLNKFINAKKNFFIVRTYWFIGQKLLKNQKRKKSIFFDI